MRLVPLWVYVSANLSLRHYEPFVKPLLNTHGITHHEDSHDSNGGTHDHIRAPTVLSHKTHKRSKSGKLLLDARDMIATLQGQRLPVQVGLTPGLRA